MTKEELLQKGVSEEAADEIIAAFEAKEDPENSLHLLEKALNEGSHNEESLFKAKDEDDDDEDGGDDYDEEYMKKYMKRYMSANKKSCGKMAKEVGIFSEDMKKAVSDIDPEANGAIIEMVDLKPILQSQVEFNESLVKALNTISERVTLIADQNEQSFDIMQKAARVQVEQAKALDVFIGQPTGRKGVTSVTPMAKAAEIAITPEATKEIYSVLMKATKAGDQKAGLVISTFESCGKKIGMLNADHRQYISELLNKEAH